MQDRVSLHVNRETGAQSMRYRGTVVTLSEDADGFVEVTVSTAPVVLRFGTRVVHDARPVGAELDRHRAQRATDRALMPVRTQVIQDVLDGLLGTEDPETVLNLAWDRLAQLHENNPNRIREKLKEEV